MSELDAINNEIISQTTDEYIEPSNTVEGDPLSATSELNLEAYSIKPGEGWYMIMFKLGITDPATQFNILQIAGPRLQEIGAAYQIDGNYWGVNAEDRLTSEALDIIWESSQLI